MIPENGQSGDLELFSDPGALEAVIEDVPSLVVLREFAAHAATIAWYNKIGTPLSAATRAMARAYLDTLGFPDVEIALVEGWEEAASAAESLDWNPAGWEAEEQLTAALTNQALSLMSEDALAVALAHVRAQVSADLHDTIADNAAMWDMTDETLIHAAAGAVLQASHQAALALSAEADPAHPLALKFQLFEAGRWPIGIAGATLNLF